MRRKLRSFMRDLEKKGGKYLNYIWGLDKWAVYTLLSGVESIKPHLPLTKRYQNDQDLIGFLDEYGSLYLKACRGRKGYQVMRVVRLNRIAYHYSFFGKDDRVRSRVVDQKTLLRVVHHFVHGAEFLIQQAIDLPVIDGRIVDMRAEVQRNGLGELEADAICVRVSQRGSPITTHAESHRFEEFFGQVMHFSSSRIESLRYTIQEFLFRVYTALESFYGPVSELGIDFALDTADRIWLIECNSQPTKVSLMKAYDAETIEKAFLNPLQYAKYLSRKSIEKKQRSSREMSLDRAAELKKLIAEFTARKQTIPRGRSRVQEENRAERKALILSILEGDERDWRDWQWQLRNRISDPDILSRIITLDAREVAWIDQVQEKYRWGVSPYYASLLDDDPCNPVRLQSIPSLRELESSGYRDPMGEEHTNPAGAIVRRYPDRLIVNVTNICGSFCRHCQRRRNIGTQDKHVEMSVLEESIKYIRENGEIRDILLTGGDPLTLTDDFLDWLLGEIHAIPTVECIRIGTRVLVTLPQRINDELLHVLRKYPPLYIITQFNHPLEITRESKEACEKLANAGVVLANQTVLLKSVNNDKYVMRLLNQELLQCRVRPYYLFHAKQVSGTMHFVTSVDEGLSIMEHLRGYTSGLAIPTYVVNAPEGKGKIPISPQHVVSREKGLIKLRTWEGKIIDYPNAD